MAETQTATHETSPAPAPQVSIDPEITPADVSMAIPIAATLPLSPRPAHRRGKFRVDDDGVWLVAQNQDSDDSEDDTWICSRLDVVAQTRNADGEDWGLLLELVDSDNLVKQWAMPASMMAGDGSEYRNILLSKGLRIAPGIQAKNALAEYLITSKVAERARCVTRIGWYDSTFIMPNESIGTGSGEKVILQRGDDGDHAMRTAGTLDEWKQEIALKCIGNSRLVFAVSAAFAAPLLYPVGEEGGGFNYRGLSSTGKTTALRVAASVWGGGGSGYIKRWRATSNGLESVAEAHCDSLLLLDELGQVSAQDAGEIAYMLANGTGKVRSTKTGGARRVVNWRVLFLSAGEIGLAEHMKSAGKQARAGQEIRLADIPVDAGAGMGIFEQLNGADDPDTLARQLADASGRLYGTPIREFLRFVVADLDRVRQSFKDRRDTFIADLVPQEASGEVSRVAGRFALVAAAGELARVAGVVPWGKGEAARAAEVCFKAWLQARGGAGARDVEAAIVQVRKFIATHSNSRFQYLQEDFETRMSNVAGYRKSVNGVSEYLILGDVFREEVCTGFDPTMVARELLKRGFLKPGGEHGKLTTKVTAGRQGRVSVYRILSTILNTGE